ncbi:MAG: asparagine synthase (glutamine-hydrolyzing) [Clostridia bacterium]|nr:asparagine synthase (glutamine-hydrolyzing) [Clostridia bacterium]
MCGIAGWISDNQNLCDRKTLLDNMSKTLKKRGPDEDGIYIEKNVAMIHRRLAVVDIEHGKQPMIYREGNEIYVLVYNGELYNSEEIRQELKLDGFEFEGHSDTEVLLKAYVRWKEGCAQKLNGIFAFAVYETKRRRLFLCRDRIGVKPLFFTKKNGELVFGSQIKTVLASRVAEPTVTETGLYEIFFLGPARTPGCGVFRDIEEILPGEFAIYEKGNLRRQKYFFIEAKEHEENEQETIEHTRFLIQDSIRRQLVSDVPLCCFLSGGLDSSIITQTASDYHKEMGLERINTYSVEYRDNDKYFQKSLFQPNQDIEYISLMIENAQTNHHQVIIENELLQEALPQATLARDLPGMADVDSSLLLFCREVKNDFTVALSGECADELFGGYPWYHNQDILFEECFPWSRSQNVRRSILKDGILAKGEEYVKDRYLETVALAQKLPSDSRLTARMREMFMLNFYWFMQCLLDRKDRCSMDCGLEVRVPFCDYRIVEYAYNMPWELKALGGREKGIVRKAFEGILPHDICYRKKSPYPKTHNPIYFELVAEKVKGILQKKSVLNELLSEAGIHKIIENPDSIDSPWYGQLMRAPQILAYIIQLDSWFEEYKVRIDI